MADGDTLFSLATGQVEAEFMSLLAIVPDVVEDAILDAVSRV